MAQHSWRRRLARRWGHHILRVGPAAIRVVWRQGRWNDTIRRPLDRFRGREIDVVLLNDVRIPPGFIRFLTRAMRSAKSERDDRLPRCDRQARARLPCERTSLV